MYDVNDNSQFLEWILSLVEKNPEAIRHFLQQDETVQIAFEHFKNDWFDFCETSNEEPRIPYQITLQQPIVADMGAAVWTIRENTRIAVLGREGDMRVCEITQPHSDLKGRLFRVHIKELRDGQ